MNREIRNSIFGLSEGGSHAGIPWSSYWATRTPSALTLTVLSNTSVKLDWTNAGTGYDGTSIERSINGVTYAEIDIVLGTTVIYTDTSLDAGTYYYYRVRAYKGTHYSDYSNIVEGPWYLTGGVSYNDILAIWQPKSASNITNSYINIKSPGTHDLSVGNAPAFDTTKGWTFDGTQYLISDIVNGSKNTVIVSISEATTPGTGVIYAVFGAYEATGTKAYLIQNAVNVAKNRGYYRGGGLSPWGYVYEGTMAIAGANAYFNGIAEKVAIPAGTLATGVMYVGAVNYNLGTAIQFFKGTISSMIILTATLNAAQTKAICEAMPTNTSVPIARSQQQIDYNALQFGGFICWNMASFVDMEWANADLDPNTFAPSDLDIDNWLDACVSAGMKYALLTVKHHDGFCLWPTTFADPAHSPYSIAQTTWYSGNGNPDVTELFVDKCNSKNLKPCLYFSIWDITHEARSGTDETTDAVSYISMIKTQLTELLSNYGEITAIWFDGWNWDGNAYSEPKFTNIPFATIYNHVKSLQPNCLVIVNNHFNCRMKSEIEVFENINMPSTNLIFGENAKTIRSDSKWFYNSTLDQSAAALKSAASLHTVLTDSNSYKCNYLLGITIDKTGHLPAAQVTRLADVGVL